MAMQGSSFQIGDSPDWIEISATTGSICMANFAFDLWKTNEDMKYQRERHQQDSESESSSVDFFDADF